MTSHNGKHSFTRRSLFKAAAAVGGAYAASKVMAGGLIGNAHAQFAPAKEALLIINLRGGYNSLFCSADSFLNQFFGVTATNIQDLGNGLFIDKPTFGTLPAASLQRMATIGVRHGITSHENGQDAMFHVDNRSAPLVLADAMGGDGSIKACYMGGDLEGDHTPVNGVSLQRITDMGSTIAALGGLTNPTIPDREIASKALIGSREMSRRELQASPVSLRTVDQGFPAVIDTLQKPVKVFNFAEAAQAYGMGANQTAVNSFTSQMLAAELMVNAGSNVIIAQNGGWDTHGDTDGATVRQRMNSVILPGLRTFLNRMWSSEEYNITVAFVAEFARSLPGSDHQANISCTVIGKHVKVGTTGRTDNDVRLTAGTPSVPGLWAYLAAATKTPTMPFGQNPHGLIL